MKSSTLIFAVASLLIIFITMSVDAGVEVLSPYTGITWNGGDTEKITWKENTQAPLLSSLKTLTITLMAGTQDAQHPVVVIASNVQGSSLTVSYAVPKTLGPSGSFYFLKFSQDTYLAFSGYFSIEGISGTIPNFNSSNPGASSTTANPSSTSSSSSTDTDTDSTTSSSSLNSTATSSKPKLSSTLDSSTPASLSTGKGNSGPTQSPAAKSSGNSNKLATSLSTLSLTLFVMAFYLF